ncbi:MAG: hypothetical protein M0R30_04445 [Methanoregula sp.]|jgi:hypothetical protein|uniref:hypothetical protein n=1 Tax=Methanoregula sp. TaxID=2052170 RepID=UPI0025D545CD|nr:hypothetical protein [Methanoregula sp.]MCK9630869.1 hypothetical protein [Methanoregula sp.]
MFFKSIPAEQVHEAIHRIGTDLHSACPETNRVYVESGSLPDMATACVQREP